MRTGDTASRSAASPRSIQRKAASYPRAVWVSISRAACAACGRGAGERGAGHFSPVWLFYDGPKAFAAQRRQDCIPDGAGSKAGESGGAELREPCKGQLHTGSFISKRTDTVIFECGCNSYKEVLMTAKLATIMFVAGALLVPATGYAAGTKESAPGATSTTEKVKESLEDAAITTKIKTDFATDKQVSALKIHVDTDNGVVTLSGDAKTKEEANKAVSIAKNTKGVMSVKNEIKVGASTAKY